MSVGSVESASVRISVVNAVLKWDSSSLHSLTKQRDSGSFDNNFMATEPILLESIESEVSCLRKKNELPLKQVGFGTVEVKGHKCCCIGEMFRPFS